MKNDENFRDFATMVIDFNKEKLKEDNKVLGSGKFQNGSIEIGGQFIEGFIDKETGIVYSRQINPDTGLRQAYEISPEIGQFYPQQDSTKYMDNIKLVADGALSEKILKEQIALLRSPGGKTASGASGIILKTVETLGNLPGEVLDGFRGGISQDFSQTGVTEEFSERTNKALQDLERTLQKRIDKDIETAQKQGKTDTASQTLGKLQVNARMLTYTLANSLKEKDRLTNRDLQLIEELTKTLGLEPDEKIIQRYEELLKRVQQKQRLRLNKFYVMGNTYRDVQGILKNLGTEAIVESTTPEIFTTEDAFSALGIN
jgi:mRNA-degrading endonuclease RelE of RelBE toxin-antitoxin system